MAMSSGFAGKKCPMCSFEAATVRIVWSHLRIVHSHDPRFNVTCGGANGNEGNGNEKAKLKWKRKRK